MSGTTRLILQVPPWVEEIAPAGLYVSKLDRMRLVVDLARENVTRRNGGPFGAAVFECATGRLIASGVNLVLPMKNSILHAEIVAIMLAEKVVEAFTLGPLSGAKHELWTSCEPCAMCLGAIHWSGVSRLVTGATRDDVEAVGFNEGPVFEESYHYLQRRGLEIDREVLRAEARAVLELYAGMNGQIY